MKKILLASTALLILAATPSVAQDYSYAAPLQAQAEDRQAPEVRQDPVMEHIFYLQTEWAKIKYQIPGDEAKLAALSPLEEYAAKVTATYVDRAEPKIWEAIILSTDAGIVKGLSALGKVKKARALLEAALKIDPQAMEGSAHTSLGSLYYQVPGWPVAFGDRKKAEKHLKTALQINPDGIDPNFFYGDFLIEAKRASEAKPYLERALMAPDRPGRELADAGRRQEIRSRLSGIQ